jgi:hypothetical protein
MKLWEYVIKADSQADLTDRDVGLKWIEANWRVVGLPLYQPSDGGKPSVMWSGGQRDLILQMFEEMIHTLRSIVPRLKACPTKRKAGISADAADFNLRAVMRWVRLKPKFKESKGRRTASLFTKGTFDGFEYSLDDAPKHEDAENLNIFTHFYGRVLLSLVIDNLGSYCSRCGKGLGLTPTGRIAKGMCDACRYAARKAEDGGKAIREIWKRAKQKQRGTEPKHESKKGKLP